MIHKQNRVKIECDNCKKETDWYVMPDQPKAPKETEGWIIGYNISGKIDYDLNNDFCSGKCLHEAIDEYLNPSKEKVTVQSDLIEERNRLT